MVDFESVNISVGGGSSQSEVSWEILDSNGNIVLSASGDDDDEETDGAPYSNVTCLELGCYTVQMTDGFGDGWEGNVMTLTTGSGYTWEFTLGNGAIGSDVFAVGLTEPCGIVFGCMDSSADNYNPEATLDFTDGSCEYSCPGETQVSITLDGGSWQAEASWEIVDIDGAILMSGGSPFSSNALCLPDGCFTLNMYDSFGDGWNGDGINNSRRRS